MGFSVLEMNFKDTVGFLNVIFHLLLLLKNILLINFPFHSFKHIILYKINFDCF